MARTTLHYLEQRYATLEKEINNALLQGGPWTLADLKHRQAIIADELKEHRRLVERFALPG